MDKETGELGKRLREEATAIAECDGDNNEATDPAAAKLPKKRFFRTRAHCNPLSYNDGFDYPISPANMSWEAHFPNIPDEQRIVRVLDIGMGFGGLTVELAKLLPESMVLGMEIRAKVCEYVRQRIEALRKQHAGSYQNCSCLRTNCMRYLPNFFHKHQMQKIFVCFPDPHFKAKNFRRRIVSNVLLSEYAYFLEPGGRLYTVTDVEELHKWHVEKCDAHPYFRRLPNEEIIDSDPCVRAMLESTEESKKVARLGGNKHFAVYEHISFDAQRDYQRQTPVITALWPQLFEKTI